MAEETPECIAVIFTLQDMHWYASHMTPTDGPPSSTLLCSWSNVPGCVRVFMGNRSERDDIIAGRESLITGRTKQWPSNYSLHCFVLWSDRVVNWIVFYWSQHINETQNEDNKTAKTNTVSNRGCGWQAEKNNERSDEKKRDAQNLLFVRPSTFYWLFFSSKMKTRKGSVMLQFCNSTTRTF